MVCVWPFGLLDYGSAALRWRNPRKGRDQILPSGNLALAALTAAHQPVFLFAAVPHSENTTMSRCLSEFISWTGVGSSPNYLMWTYYGDINAMGCKRLCTVRCALQVRYNAEMVRSLPRDSHALLNNATKFYYLSLPFILKVKETCCKWDCRVT